MPAKTPLVDATYVPFYNLNAVDDSFLLGFRVNLTCSMQSQFGAKPCVHKIASN